MLFAQQLEYTDVLAQLWCDRVRQIVRGSPVELSTPNMARKRKKNYAQLSISRHRPCGPCRRDGKSYLRLGNPQLSSCQFLFCCFFLTKKKPKKKKQKYGESSTTVRRATQVEYTVQPHGKLCPEFKQVGKRKKINK